MASYHSGHFKAVMAGDWLDQTIDVGTLAGWVGLCHEDPLALERDVAIIRAMENDLTATH